MDLAQKKCVPCEGGTLPLAVEAAGELIRELRPEWQFAEESKKIRREFKFKDFRAAIHFVTEVAAIANAEDHHPDILIFYNRVVIELWTHAIGGLSENDFIVAAKVEALPDADVPG